MSELHLDDADVWSALPSQDDEGVRRVEQDGEQPDITCAEWARQRNIRRERHFEEFSPDIARRLEELEEYCCGDSDDVLSLEGLEERVRGIPPDAVRGSDLIFFLRVCRNWNVTLEMIEYLLDSFPHAARWTNSDGDSPLHCACAYKHRDPRIVRLLLDSWPESLSLRNELGNLPLHTLCANENFGEADALAILNLLLKAAPQSAAELDRNGDLPIHVAIWKDKSYPFIKRLIDAYPDSLRVQDGDGYLPIHLACGDGTFETVMYMLDLYPESIGARTEAGDLPIHWVAYSFGSGKTDIIKLLLTTDPDAASKTGSDERLPLHFASHCTNLDAVRLLFDAYPEAINIQDGRGRTPIDLVAVDAASGPEVRRFLEDQLAYARMAEGATRNGLLLLHALWNGASLGAIKLLIAGNRDALQASANQSASLLHIACEYSTAGVVNYLLELGVPSVSEDSNGKLPVHLLCGSDRVDRNSVEYVEAVWRLLLAHPETVMH